MHGGAATDRIADGIRRPWARRRAGPRKPVSVKRALAQFAGASLAAVLLIGFVGAQLLIGESHREATGDAKELARLAGRGIVQPALTDPVLTGDAAALARLDRLVRTSVLGRGIVRVKIWTPQGRIVYSDARMLIGSSYPLSQEELRSLRSGAVNAEALNNPTGPENRFERGLGRLLEVYLPIHTPSGHRLLFEAFLPSNEVSASARHLLTSFAPALVVGLALLALVQIPLAWSLARNLRRRQQERAALLARAIEASDDERRRIARDLHDGVVQELAGIAYSLAATADTVDAEAPDAIRSSLRDSAAQTRQSIRSLRSLLVEIYPASLRTAGLPAALSDLTAKVESSGIRAQLHYPPTLALSEEAEALLYRVAQEALRNVTAHAQAQHAEVTVAASGSMVTLLVSDDGVGFTADEVLERARGGHLGLGLVADLVREHGGRLDVSSTPGHGTAVRVEIDRL